jgi:chemotaxis protein histidine kinase CheA
VSNGVSIASLVVPAAAVLAGVAVGKTWDVLASGVQWTRQQRATAYAEFLAAVEAIYFEMSQETRDYSAEKVDACVREATRADAVIDMFGSKDVAERAHKLWNFVALELNSREIAELDEAAWSPISDRFRTLIDAFRDVARRDLRQKPLGPHTARPAVAESGPAPGSSP